MRPFAHTSPILFLLPGKPSGHRTLLLLFCRLAGLLAVLLLITSCSEPQPVIRRATHPRPPLLTPTPLPPRPSPVALLLDPPPTDCLASQPPPNTLSVTNQFGIPGMGKLLGSPPVWITDFSYPVSPLHLEVGGYTDWPQWKVVWEVGPNDTQPVHLQVRNLRTGDLAWWGSQPDTWVGQTFLLDPKEPDVNGPGWYHGFHSGYPGALAGQWNEWGSAFLISRAGCYALEATWPGGQWSILFAAGR
jgi:hypothetical protein